MRCQRVLYLRPAHPAPDGSGVIRAIQNLWLAARSEGLGMGWVSLFDPQRLAALLAMPADAEPVAILCLGPVPGSGPARAGLDGWAYTRGHSRIRLQPMELSVGAGHRSHHGNRCADREVDVFGRHVKGQR